MKISVCEKCRYCERKTWSSCYKPSNYHSIGISHAYAYCSKYNERCLDIKKCSEHICDNKQCCPLHPVAEREAELIKRIKLAIRKQVHLMEDSEHCYPQNAVCWQDIVAILDQVSRENNYGK